MPYIGVSPQFGVRRKHTYTATAGQTSFSGAGSEGATLSYRDSTFVDVYQNGIKLGDADYTSTSGTAIVLTQGASVDDLVEIIVFDVFSAADTVSKADGGTFDGNVTMGGTLAVTGTSTLTGNATMSGNVSIDGGTIKLDGNFPTGTDNVALGNGALDDGSLSGGYNVAIGSSALGENEGGTQNCALGYNSLDANTSGGSNTGIGNNALGGNTTASNNTAVGNQSMQLNETGAENTALGSLALKANTTGGSQTAVGYQALTTSQDGAGNSALGYRALYDMTSGARNVGLGEQAGRGITTGNDNIGAGTQSFYAACTGSSNVGLGYRSFFSATSAASNVGVGYQTLSDMNSGSENVAVGYRALPHVSTGDSNIGIGIQTGDGDRGTALTTGASNILMGRQVDVAAADNSYCGVFGVHAVGKGSSTGHFSFNDGAIYQGNNNANWTTTSDIRIKKNIVDSNIGLEELKKIQVRNFEYRTKDEITEVPSHAAINKQGVQVGVIAQEIQAVLPDTVKEESTGVLSVNPDNLTWHLVKAVQELSAKNDELEARIKKLEEG
jgi:hypothetical protein